MWGAQQGFNQWALQPAMFNDVPHEQIDWAALAKQWIQMQQVPPTTEVPPGAVPPIAPADQSVIPPPPPGHETMLPEEFIQDLPPVTQPLLKTPIAPGAVPEHFQPERHFEPDPATFVPKTVNNSYWSKPQWEGVPGNNDSHMWPVPPPVESSLVGGKETYDYGHMHDNPPLTMQSIDYNHMSEFSYGQVYVPPPETQYDQYWSQVNAAPPITPIFLKKQRSSAPSSSHRTEEDTSQIDAAKRKQLPAWIREGLEKMEQERIKKIEKEKAEKEKAEKLAMEKLKAESDSQNINPAFIKSKFDSDSEPEIEEAETKPSVPKQSPPIKKRSPSPVDVRTEEEKRQEHMLNVRRLLTEILLSVTTSEMYAVAEEVLKKERLKARQLASTTSLSTVATGLRGLASYGTESEASDQDSDSQDTDSEEELYQRIREKKKLFAVKSKKILAEIERKELEQQNEALKAKNDIAKVTPTKHEEPEVIVLPEKIMPETAAEVPVIDIDTNNETQSSDMNVVDTNFTESDMKKISELNALLDESLKKSLGNNNQNKNTNEPENDHTSHSVSNSSESENESSKRYKKKSIRDEHEKKTKKEKDKSPSKKHRRRSKSSDSDSSEKHHKSRSSEKYRRNSGSKKKKYKRSDSSSSSSSDSKRRHSSKSESSHNRHRDRRSHSYEDKDRKRRRSLSPRSYRSSKDYRRSKDSHSHREKYEKRDYYDKRSSPHRQSSKLPKKYRSSRTPSSERESRKSKKSRTR